MTMLNLESGEGVMRFFQRNDLEIGLRALKNIYKTRKINTH